MTRRVLRSRTAGAALVSLLTLTGLAVTAPSASAAPAQLPVNPRTGLPVGMAPTSAYRASYQAAHPTSSPRSTASGPSGFAAAAGAHLNWYGGAVVSNAQVASVLWGSGTYLPEVTGSTTPDFATFFQGVTRSPYTSWLGEYDANNQTVGLGSYLSSTTISPSVPGTTVDDAQIQTELVNDVSSGALPPTAVDAAGNPNTVYALFFPAGTTVTQGGFSSGVDFCAYHGTTSGTVNGKHLLYMVLPDDTTGGMTTGCGTGTSFQVMTSYASHELGETITDPGVGIATTYAAPLAWYDATNGEIADICNGQQGTVVGSDGVTYTVEALWSNAVASCIVQKAGPLDHVAVQPAAPTETAGVADQVMVQGFDASGNSLGDVTPTSALSISPDGTCGSASCTATVAGSHTISATDAGKTAGSAVSVVPAALDHVALSPASASLQAGYSRSYALTGYDVYGNSRGTLTPASLTVTNGSCTTSACTSRTLGTQTVTATYPGVAAATAALSVVDTVAPTATLTRPTALVSLTGSTVVAWGGSDSGSGVARYQLRYQRAAWNGTFSAWAYPSSWQALTGTSLTVTGIPRGYDYCWSVRSVDRAGNASAWTGRRCTAVPLDDRSVTPSSGWSRPTSSTWWNSTATVTKTKGVTMVRSSARLSRVGIVATRCSTCGVVAVYVAGGYVGQINLASSTTHYRSVVLLPWFSQRYGTVTLKVVSATGKLVQVDGLVVSQT